MMKRLFYEVGRTLRETGTALDRAGLSAMEKPIFKEAFSRHRPVMNLYDKHPSVDTGSFVAPNATVVGDVSIAYMSHVWYGAVVRGDQGKISIGGYTNIQDRAVVTTSKPVGGEGLAMTKIGSHVTVGPGAVLTSCTVEGHNHIGAGAVIGQGALVEEFAIVSEGTVVHPGRRIPSGQMWAGNPAQFVRNVTKEEMAALEMGAEEISNLALEHSAEFLPDSAVHLDAESQAEQQRH